jgi:hypothetical protein
MDNKEKCLNYLKNKCFTATTKKKIPEYTQAGPKNSRHLGQVNRHGQILCEQCTQ